MPQSSRTFRIFVSSTFSDLKAERNALQEKVFPRLRDLAVAHGCRFQAIDLRWGISEEAALDQQTMKICLEEIERCQKITPRPNFIILLGDRYGWQPVPYEIHASEFEEIIENITDLGERYLVESWYRRDDNAIPPAYFLQARTNEFINPEKWKSVEEKIHNILEREADRIHISPEALRKYTTSATEQEVVAGAMKIPDAQEHVFGIFRGIKGLPQDNENYGNPDAESAQKQEELKKRLKEQLFDNIHEYVTHWQGDGPSLDYLDQLIEDVYTNLSKVILTEIGQLESVDRLDKEISSHDEFGKARARVFIGRTEIQNKIFEYIESNDPHPLLVWGASGSGKSALMARVVQQVRENRKEVICRFIGATPESSNGRSLLESLCRQIQSYYGVDGSKNLFDYEYLVQEFTKCLALATSKKPLIIFLDALDQLSDVNNARSLDWFPVKLPPHVHLIVSALPGECVNQLERRLPGENCRQLLPMPKSEGESLLELWLTEIGRTLQPDQRMDIIVKFQKCGLPLYLRLAFEEGRRWRSFDDLPAGANDIPGLGEDIPGLLRDLFWRLSLVSNHGGVLVARSLEYLSAAKNGLSENEMLDILSADTDVLEDFQIRSPKSLAIERLPVVVWSRLYLDLEPYLMEYTADGVSLITFYHRQFREGVELEYLKGNNRVERHRKLAEYFGSQPPVNVQGEEIAFNLRKTSEQVYQECHGKMWGELFTTLTDFSFLEARCWAASVFDLESDYLLALQNWQGEGAQGKVLAAFEDRLRLESHAINKAPELLFPQLYNRLTWLDLPNGPIHELCERAASQHHAWLRMTQDPRPEPPLWLRSMEGHTDWVIGTAVTPNGAQVVSGSADHTLKIWELRTGHLLHSLEGHIDSVQAVGITPDGTKIISGSADYTIKIWDLTSGCLLRSLEGHVQGIDAVAVTPDGTKIVSGSADSTVKIWDISTGSLLRTLKGHKSSVFAVVITPDSEQIISGSSDNTLKVWDLATGRLLHSLQRHTNPVNAVAITPDGKQIVSGSSDHTIKIWDLQSGCLLRSIKSRTIHSRKNDFPNFDSSRRAHRLLNVDIRVVTSVAVTPFGAQIISGSADGSLNVWDLATGRLLRSLKGHTEYVNTIAITPDGTQVISGSNDDTLKVWEFATGRLLSSLQGHTEYVNTVAITPDGTQVISGSNDDTLKVWEFATGRLLCSLQGHTGMVTTAAVTPDGTQVVSGAGDHTLKVWNLASGRLLRSLKGHTDTVAAVAVTPDGTRAVSGSFDHTIKIWDLATGHMLHSLKRHMDLVKAVAITPNGAQIVSGSADHTLKIWELQTGHLLHSLEGHLDSVQAIAITPDGTQIVSGSADHTIKIWDLTSGCLLRSLEGHLTLVDAVAVTPDGTNVVSGSSDSTIKIWDIRTGDLLRTLKGHKDSVFAVAVTPDNEQIVSGSCDHTLKVWDIKNNHQLRSLEGHSGMVKAIAVTQDGAQVISASEDRSINVWNIQTGLLVRSLEGHSGSVDAVAVTPDDTRIVSGSNDGTIKIWNLATGGLERTLDEHASRVTAVVVTPDGTQVISGSRDKTIKVWDLVSGCLLHSWEGHSNGIYALAVTPDSTQIVSGSADNTLMIWDLTSGRLLRLLEGHMVTVSAVAITPDGAQVISGSGDYLIKVWDLKTGRLLNTLEGHSSWVTSLAVMLDGCYLVSASEDKTIMAWNIDNGLSLSLFANDCFIPCLAVSPDGHWLTCGDIFGRVWMFEWMK